MRVVCCVLLLACVSPGSLAAQQSAPTQVARPDAKAAAPKPESPELKRARQLLATAEAQARGLEAPMRALTLFQIGEAVAGFDRAHAAELMQDAFRATTEMDPAKPGDKRFLQDRILSALLNLDADAVASLLPQAEPDSRSNAYGLLITHAAQAKNFARAMDLLNQVSAEQIKFPYTAATALMVALPADAAAERQNAFLQAFSAYQRDPGSGISTDGFDRLIVRFAGVLPQRTILDAVDEVLNRAKDSDSQAQISLSSANGSASFNSAYDYYLFELLPVIRRYDAARADDLLKQNTQLQPVMAQLPNGVQSIDPTIRDTPVKRGEHSGMSVSIRSGGSRSRGASGSGGLANAALTSSGANLEQVRAQYSAEVARIEQDAAKNPKQAAARALALPDPVAGVHFRADALEAVARAAWKKDPGVAKDTLDELVQFVSGLKPMERHRYLFAAANLYLDMDDKDAARKVVDAGVKTATDLYEDDRNPDDPNEALKGYWPSTETWAEFVMLAQRVSPDLPPQIIAGIKDDEVRTSVEVAYASALSGGGAPRNRITMINRKGSHSISMSQ